MSLRDDILALTATLNRLSCGRGKACSSDYTEMHMDDTISAVSVAVEEGDVRGHSTPPRARSVVRRLEEDTLTALPNSRDTTALPHGGGKANGQGRLSTNARGGGIPGPVGRESVATRRPPLAPAEATCRAHGYEKGNDVGEGSNSYFEPVSSESCGVSTEPSGTEPAPSHTEEAYKKVARRLLLEIQRLDSCIATASARQVDERKEFLHTQHELKEQLAERDMLIGALQHQLKLARGSEKVSTNCCCFSGADHSGVQSPAARTASNERFTSRSRSGSGVPTTAAPIFARPSTTTTASGEHRAGGSKTIQGHSNRRYSIARGEEKQPMRVSSISGSEHHQKAVTAAPSLQSSEGNAATGMASGGKLHSKSASPDALPPFYDPLSVCRSCVHTSQERCGPARRVEVSYLPQGMRPTPQRRSRLYSFDSVGGTVCRRSRHCSTCQRRAMATTPGSQRYAEVASPAAAPSSNLSHSPLPRSADISDPATGARGQMGRGSSQSPARRSKRRSLTQVHRSMVVSPKPAGGHRLRATKDGGVLLNRLAAKSALLEAGLIDVMERLDEQQGELRDVTYLLHKLVLSSAQGNI